jgi:hypothetical protein
MFGINPHFAVSALFMLADCFSLMLELCRMLKTYDFTLCSDDLTSTCRPA